METLSLQDLQANHADLIPDIVKHMNQSHCTRCGGMMVRETCMDVLSDYDKWKFQAQHCIQCGELIDPFILLNRFKRRASHTG